MAGAVAFGPEFLVNTSTALFQQVADVIGLADGRFVIDWTDDGADGSISGVVAQAFNADGTHSGGPMLVNTITAGPQNAMGMTALSDGRYVITYYDGSTSPDDPSLSAIRAQIFNANGSHFGTEFLVNTDTFGGQTNSVATALDNGRFIIVWMDSSTATGAEIHAQLYGANGARDGGEFQVNTTTFSTQDQPSVTTLSNGQFVITWYDESAQSADGSKSAIQAQMFNANGTPFGSEFLVNTTTNDFQVEPAITALASGGFVITWTDTSLSTMFDPQYDIKGQIYDAAGAKSGGEFLVNTTTLSLQFNPDVTALADGKFVVVWKDFSSLGGDASPTSIKAQVFNANGTHFGTEFLVNTTTNGGQSTPQIAALADGRFVVTWTDSGENPGDTSDDAVRGQIFDARTAAINLTGTALADGYVGTRFADTMAGGLGNDTLIGGAGGDRLLGGQGRDHLIGGAGADRLTGGNGADVFVFGPADGKDRVTDYIDGTDRIDLSAFGFADFASAASHFANAGADLVFSFGTDTLTIQNFAMAGLNGGDLIL